MTYNDIITTPGNTNAHVVQVEHYGVVTEHWITSKSYDDAVAKLVKTGWFANSARNIH